MLPRQLFETEAAQQIGRATVLGFNREGVPLVSFEGSGRLACDVLCTSEGPAPRLAPGDTVLVWAATAEGGRGVILGRVGASRAPAPREEPPDELVIEAKKNLTIKCGEGSITFRGDGKVLLKGKDLVSHAQRVNRVKGGSVAIN
jgi:hypothetical protein